MFPLRGPRSIITHPYPPNRSPPSLPFLANPVLPFFPFFSLRVSFFLSSGAYPRARLLPHRTTRTAVHRDRGRCPAAAIHKRWDEPAPISNPAFAFSLGINFNTRYPIEPLFFIVVFLSFFFFTCYLSFAPEIHWFFFFFFSSPVVHSVWDSGLQHSVDAPPRREYQRSEWANPVWFIRACTHFSPLSLSLSPQYSCPVFSPIPLPCLPWFAWLAAVHSKPHLPSTPSLSVCGLVFPLVSPIWRTLGANVTDPFAAH